MKSIISNKDRLLSLRHEEVMTILNRHIAEEEKRLVKECKTIARRIGNQE